MDRSETLKPRPLRADARRNRAKVLAAGRELFAVDGAGAGMDDVAARAGVGLGTVYRHFPTKAALAAEIVSESLDQFAEFGRAARASQPTAWDAFVTTLQHTLEFIEGDVGTRHAVAQVNPDAWVVVIPARERLHLVYTEIIRAAQAEGSLRRDFTSEDLEMVIRGITSSMGDVQAGADWHRHVTYLLDGLRTPRAAE